MKSLVNNKTPANDGLKDVFYKAIWNQLKDPLFKIILSVKTSNFLIHKGKPQQNSLKGRPGTKDYSRTGNQSHC